MGGGGESSSVFTRGGCCHATTTRKQQCWNRILVAVGLLLVLANLLQGVGLTTTVVGVPPEEDPSSLARTDDADAATKNNDATVVVASSENLIPPHIHLIHVTPGLPADAPVEIPPAVRSNLERWRNSHGIIPSETDNNDNNHNDHWKLTLWNNQRVRREFPELVSVLERLQVMSHASDLLRYAILDRYGGFYVDTDVVSFRSLEPLRALPTFGVCESPFVPVPPPLPIGTPTNQTTALGDLPPTVPVDDCEYLCSTPIGTRPHHPAVQDMFAHAWNATLKAMPVDKATFQNHFYRVVGPVAWSRVAKTYNVTTLVSYPFFPCSWQDTTQCNATRFRDDPRVFAMHAWASSWNQ